jgi:hypothetical protein
VIVNVDVPVARRREGVFALMADARNEPSWNSRVSETDLLTEEPIGLGSQFRTVNRGQEYTATLTAYKPLDQLTFEVVGKTMKIVGQLQFSELGNSTVLKGTFDLQPIGAMKLMMPLMAWTIRKDFPLQFFSFKTFCEAALSE